MVAEEVDAESVAVPDDAEFVVVESLEAVVEEAGAAVIEEEPDEAVAVPEADEDEDEAAVEAEVAVAEAAHVAVVGRRSALPTEPQMALANSMVATMVGMISRCDYDHV